MQSWPMRWCGRVRCPGWSSQIASGALPSPHRLIRHLRDIPSHRLQHQKLQTGGGRQQRLRGAISVVGGGGGD